MLMVTCPWCTPPLTGSQPGFPCDLQWISSIEDGWMDGWLDDYADFYSYSHLVYAKCEFICLTRTE